MWKKLNASVTRVDLQHSKQAFFVKRLNKYAFALARLIEAVGLENGRKLLRGIKTERFVIRNVLQLHVQPRTLPY